MDKRVEGENRCLDVLLQGGEKVNENNIFVINFEVRRENLFS